MERFSVRVAKEGKEAAFHVLRNEPMQLVIESRTLTLTSSGTPVLHTPLASWLFAVSDKKLMAVPRDRGPAFLFELLEPKRQRCLELLVACGADVKQPKQPPKPHELAAELEREMAAPGFAEYLRAVETALKQRVVQLPELNAMPPW